jgi:hypothetical protein
MSPSCRIELRAIAASAPPASIAIHCQAALSTIKPPMIGPRIGPSRIGTPTSASARPTRRGPALCATSVNPTGTSMPPPMPCRTRNAISSPADVASAHPAEPPANNTIDAIQVRLEPKRSVIQPESGMTDASDSR